MSDAVVPGVIAAPNTARSKGPRGQVFIHPNWCKGCRICVEFCPTGVLAFIPSQEHPHVQHPQKCSGCHWCDTHCPDLAIVVQLIA